MKAFVEVIQEEGPYHTRPLFKDIRGHICRRKHRIMFENATSVKGSPQTSTSLEEFLTLCPTLGLLLNGG